MRFKYQGEKIMTAKIIPFVKSTTERGNIIDFEDAVNRLNRRALEELTSQESLLDTNEERCDSYHPTMKGFKRELKQGNPDCMCCVCDGYDVDCPAYNLRK